MSDTVSPTARKPEPPVPRRKTGVPSGTDPDFSRHVHSISATEPSAGIFSHHFQCLGLHLTRSPNLSAIRMIRSLIIFKLGID